jgi:hypothetical protein
VFLRWPCHASVTDPRRLPVVANAVMAVMAEAIAKLTTIQSQGL